MTPSNTKTPERRRQDIEVTANTPRHEKEVPETPPGITPIRTARWLARVSARNSDYLVGQAPGSILSQIWLHQKIHYQ